MKNYFIFHIYFKKKRNIGISFQSLLDNDALMWEERAWYCCSWTDSFTSFSIIPGAFAFTSESGILDCLRAYATNARRTRAYV